MNKLLFTIVAIVLLLDQTSFSQTRLSGTVSDSGSGNPLQSVMVYLPELNREAITDTKGNFTFEGLPLKTLLIQISITGYRSQLISADISKQPVMNIIIKMEPSPSIQLDEVTVTANRSRLASESPYPITIISKEELKRSGSMSLTGSLSYQPGVDKISLGNGITKPVIRGLSFNRILLFAQGTRIENQQWDDRHDLGLSSSGISHIEIVKGPAALVYGSDALGGALILSDDKPLPAGKTAGEVNLGFASNTLGLNGDFGIRSTKSNGFYYGFNLSGNSQTSYLQGKEGAEGSETKEEEAFAPNSKFQSTGARAHAGWSGKKVVGKISYSYMNQKSGIIEDEGSEAGGDEAEQRDREMEAPYQDVTTHIVSSENTIITGNSRINLNVAHQTNLRKEYEPLPGKQKELAFGLNLNAETYDVKWTSDDSRPWGFTVGSQGTILTSKNNGLESLVPDAAERSLAGYGLFRYDHHKLHFMAGARSESRVSEIESYEPAGEIELDTLVILNSADTLSKPEIELEKEYAPASFSAGLAWDINNKFSAKLNFASGFTAPNYAQTGAFGKHEGTYRFEIGNTALKMEKNYETDVALSYHETSFSIELSAFYNKVNDYIYIINTGDSIQRIRLSGTDTLPVYAYLQKDATLTGGEATIRIHPKDLNWIDFRVSYATTQGKFDKGGYLPWIPSDKITGELQLKKDSLWFFRDAGLRVVLSNYFEQTRIAEYEIKGQAYHLVDVSIGGSISIGKQQASLHIYCTNLFDKAYFNQLSLVKNIGIREMGRNIGIQVRIPFGNQP